MLTIFSHLEPLKQFTPDDLAVADSVPMGPVCNRCNAYATADNIAGFKFAIRPSWDPLEENKRGGIDALCGPCFEAYRG